MAKDEPELRLNVKDALQLQYYPESSENSNTRYYVRVIGYSEGRSVLTTSPTMNGRLVLLKEGQQFAVRLLSGNSVQGFVSSVIKHTTTPYPYMHLSYPKDLESIVVRNAQRINTRIIAAVQNQEEGKADKCTKSGIISDISTTGAMVSSPQEIGDVGDLITIKTKMGVGDVAEYVNLSAIIRRCLGSDEVASDANKYNYGVQFQLVEEHDKLIINGYVYEQIVKASE